MTAAKKNAVFNFASDAMNVVTALSEAVEKHRKGAPYDETMPNLNGAKMLLDEMRHKLANGEYDAT